MQRFYEIRFQVLQTFITDIFQNLFLISKFHAFACLQLALKNIYGCSKLQTYDQQITFAIFNVHKDCIIKWIKRFQEEMNDRYTTQSCTKLQSTCQICHSRIHYTRSIKYEFEWISWKQFLQSQQKQKICIISLFILCLLCFIYALIMLSVVNLKKQLLFFIIHCLILIGCVIGIIIILIFLTLEQYICKLCISNQYHINSVERTFEQQRQMIPISSALVIEQTMFSLQ